ncbi:MAG: hypothetical protein WDW36_005589 [Sanguina aurantia]
MAGLAGAHDLGGVTTVELIDTQEVVYSYWQRRTHALMVLMTGKKVMSLDEFRRAQEALPAYSSMSYYRKWASALTAISIERGLFSAAELDSAMGVAAKEEEAKVPSYSPGDLVRVRKENAMVRWRKPHLRVPGYIHGVIGRVERSCVGLGKDAAASAYREPAITQPLYRVRFLQRHLWEGYTGCPEDSVEVEVFEPWLQPATAEDLQQQEQQFTATASVLGKHACDASTSAAPDEQGPHKKHHSHSHSHGHGHVGAALSSGAHPHEQGPRSQGHAGAGHAQSGQEQGHGHGHGEGPHDHVHEGRMLVEANAVDKEGRDSEERQLADALVAVLISKNVITAQELQASLEHIDKRGETMDGARLVARAWLDPGFKARLLLDPAAAAAELDIGTQIYPPGSKGPAPAVGPQPVLRGLMGTVLTVVENTESVHNVVVCTLCSCYPISMLGLSPAWYKDKAYRARVVREPRAVLAEFGTTLPDSVAIRVHDSTAELRYLVLPLRPVGTEGWSEEALIPLVTRDSMIGVAQPALP